MRRIATIVALAAVVALLGTGCSKKDEQKAGGPQAPAEGGVVKKETVVVVPDSVKGKWKAVKILVTDKSANKESVYTIDIGSTFAVPGGDLSIKVENFLPHFVMEGATLTSQSNEAKNPGVQIKIFEADKEVFKGWLFTLYPTTHAFQHPKYSFALVDFVPAGK